MTAKERVVHEAIFQEHILEDFLTQAQVDQPLQYIRAGLAQSRLWLPIFCFARMAKHTNEEIAEMVRALKISQKGKKKILVERLVGKRSALTKAVTHASRQMAADISKGILVVPTAVTDVSTFANAVTAVVATTASLADLLSVLQISKSLAEAADDGSALGAIFKAACRVDEMFFNV